MKENREDILSQLEQALLEEEEAEAVSEAAEEEDTEELLTESDEEQPLIYRNFSNRYGADLRNFASGYRARNTDHLDVDLDKFSEQVESAEEKTPFPWLPLFVMLLATAVTVWLLYTIWGGIL